MSKVTSKLQVTLPKSIADELGIKPGDQIDWEVAGEAVRVIPMSKRKRRKQNRQAQLRLFDDATKRQQERKATFDPALLRAAHPDREWTREDLYSRGRADRH